MPGGPQVIQQNAVLQFLKLLPIPIIMIISFGLAGITAHAEERVQVNTKPIGSAAANASNISPEQVCGPDAPAQAPGRKIASSHSSPDSEYFDGLLRDQLISAIKQKAIKFSMNLRSRFAHENDLAQIDSTKIQDLVTQYRQAVARQQEHKKGSVDYGRQVDDLVRSYPWLPYVQKKNPSPENMVLVQKQWLPDLAQSEKDLDKLSPRSPEAQELIFYTAAAGEALRDDPHLCDAYHDIKNRLRADGRWHNRISLALGLGGAALCAAGAFFTAGATMAMCFAAAAGNGVSAGMARASYENFRNQAAVLQDGLASGATSPSEVKASADKAWRENVNVGLSAASEVPVVAVAGYIARGFRGAQAVEKSATAVTTAERTVPAADQGVAAADQAGAAAEKSTSSIEKSGTGAQNGGSAADQSGAAVKNGTGAEKGTGASEHSEAAANEFKKAHEKAEEIVGRKLSEEETKDFMETRALAEKIAGRKLTDAQAKRVYESHIIGIGEKGKDLVSDAGKRNYTFGQLRRKLRRLLEEMPEDSGFLAGEPQAFIRGGAAGKATSTVNEDLKALESMLANAKQKPTELVRVVAKISSKVREYENRLKLLAEQNPLANIAAVQKARAAISDCLKRIERRDPTGCKDAVRQAVEQLPVVGRNLAATRKSAAAQRISSLNLGGLFPQLSNELEKALPKALNRASDRNLGRKGSPLDISQHIDDLGSAVKRLLGTDTRVIKVSSEGDKAIITNGKKKLVFDPAEPYFTVKRFESGQWIYEHYEVRAGGQFVQVSGRESNEFFHFTY
ncbi:MAG: hypothetical protein C5B49_03010 [Bdellovibrio sp.]|nr:MAG: hypothetical protein C5B49_03010 [Bdellovibrio sp.]